MYTFYLRSMKIAINGFGRIGRQAFKIALEHGIQVVAINDLTRADNLAHLLKFDTVYGTYPKEVKAYINDEEFIAGSESLLNLDKETIANAHSRLVVDGQEIKVLSQRDPAQLPWGELGVDVVLECTGIFVKDDSAMGHITAGAKYVVLSAPSKGDSPAPTYVLGANADKLAGEQLISNASCTTNCISPVMKVLEDTFGIEKALMTTTHAYTSTQSLVDGISDDLRRGRAAGYNLIPATTGAAIATTRVIPQLENKFDGLAIRVPVIAGSLSDITAVLKQDVTVDAVNDAFRQAAQEDRFKGILAVSDAPLVSSDIIGRSESAIVDLPMTKVTAGNMVKVLAWYDNEWGYSNRLVEMAMQLK